MPKKEKKISIIVPAYNGAKKLGACLDSIINQTMPISDYEIILVDDCSTDGGLTWNLICEYESRYPDSIIALQTEENSLPGGARNAGIPYATGELITFSDQDDTVTSNAFTTAYQLYEEFAFEVAYFCIEDIDKYGIEINDDFILLSAKTPAKKLFLASAPWTVWGNYYQTSLVKNNDLRFAPKVFHEEHPFAMPAIILAEKIILSKTITYQHAENKRSATYNPSTGMFSPAQTAGMTKAILILIDWLVKNPKAFDDFKKEIECRVIYLLFMNTCVANKHIPNFPYYSLVKCIQSIINFYFPDWQSNPYLKVASHHLLKVDILVGIEAMMTPVSEDIFAEYLALLKMLS